MRTAVFLFRYLKKSQNAIYVICTAAGDRNIIAKFNRFRCRKRNVFLFFIYRQRQL